jgi:hypothetical protein|tara:strand:- start:2127 stop:2279 length:153 start_codon:yes stop_codon:yes gene_type:complete
MIDKKIIWLVKVWAPDCVLKRQFFISCTDERMRKFKVPKGLRATYEKAKV